MEYSKNYEKVKYYYEKKLWEDWKVKNAVNKWITEEEYKEIVGEEYQEPAE